MIITGDEVVLDVVDDEVILVVVVGFELVEVLEEVDDDGVGKYEVLEQSKQVPTLVVVYNVE